MHIQDRGNVALPEDMVKILKTQDENYIRTLRSAGMKASFVRLIMYNYWANVIMYNYWANVPYRK